MSYIAYHRTSTAEQHLDRGITEIKEYSAKSGIIIDKIYTDQQTGKNFNRPNYKIMRDDTLRSGDVLIVTELDRLGRNKKDTMKEIQYYRDKGIRLMVLELPTTLMDLSSMNDTMAQMMLETINNMMLELYASMAHAEMLKKEKRQREGIQAKKDRGEWDNYGRPNAVKPKNWNDTIELMRAGKIKAKDAMEILQLKKTTFYKLLKQENTIKE